MGKCKYGSDNTLLVIVCICLLEALWIRLLDEVTDGSGFAAITEHGAQLVLVLQQYTCSWPGSGTCG